MADISREELSKAISSLLKDADLNTLSVKKVRKQLEERFDEDLTSRKKEIDEMVMNIITASQKDSQSNDEGSEDEDPDSASSEDEPSPKKKSKPSPTKKLKKSTSEGSESELDDEALARKLQDEERNSRRRAASRKVPSGKRDAKKKKDDDDKPKIKRNSGYSKKIPLSETLAELVGAKEMARHDVVKRMYEIVRERNLFDPTNKRYALCDEQLLKVFGGNKRVLLFGMLKHLKHHMIQERNE